MRRRGEEGDSRNGRHSNETAVEGLIKARPGVSVSEPSRIFRIRRTAIKISNKPWPKKRNSVARRHSILKS